MRHAGCEIRPLIRVCAKSNCSFLLFVVPFSAFLRERRLEIRKDLKGHIVRCGFKTGWNFYACVFMARTLLKILYPENKCTLHPVGIHTLLFPCREASAWNGS